MSGRATDVQSPGPASVTLFVCGDVMLGRGIDQILPHPGDPRLFELHAPSAAVYVGLAESANGPIPHAVGFDYVWGDALADLRRLKPDMRIINLETSVTKDGRPVPKGINYRMNPDNVPCLTAAAIDCCVLANNHVLDWGEAGLLETLAALDHAGIRSAGAGRDAAQAAAPAALELAGGGRVLVFGFGSSTSGIPDDWAAEAGKPGVHLLPDLSAPTVDGIARQVRTVRRAGDLLVASIHWGGNWGYEIPSAQRAFAHGLIDAAGFHLVHGHSSHHPKGIEVYKEALVLYGCGDFLNDYEGIGGYEAFRDDLAAMYLPAFDSGSGRLLRLDVRPYRIAKFRLNRASPDDTAWLCETLDRESAGLGTRIVAGADGTLSARWR